MPHPVAPQQPVSLTRLLDHQQWTYTHHVYQRMWQRGIRYGDMWDATKGSRPSWRDGDVYEISGTNHVVVRITSEGRVLTTFWRSPRRPTKAAVHLPAGSRRPKGRTDARRRSSRPAPRR